MYELKDWYLECKWVRQDPASGYVKARGMVNGHHKLLDGHHICTSRAVHLCLDRPKHRLIMDTRSGSCYELLFSEIDADCVGATGHAVRQMGVASDWLKEAVCMAEIKDQERLEMAERELEDEEILLLLYGVSVHRAYYKRDGVISLLEQISMGRHRCITDRENVQLRFFRNESMDIFSWSDGLRKVKMYNAGYVNVPIRGGMKPLCCKPGEMLAVGQDWFVDMGLAADPMW